MNKFGIEEEFCIVDADNFQMENKIFTILEDIPDDYSNGNIKSDLHECIVETSSNIHTDLDDCFTELLTLRKILSEVADEYNYGLISSGVHPFSPSGSAKLIENPRYIRLTTKGGLLENGVHFGFHLHIGIDDISQQIKSLNKMRYFIPELIAMSVNSPCYGGRICDYHSMRLHRYDRTPTVGLPLILNNWDDFEGYIETNEVYGVLEPRDVYWDIRLRPSLNTIEFRVMDSQIDVSSTISIASFILSIYSYVISKPSYDFKAISLPEEDELLHNREVAKQYGLMSEFYIKGTKTTARDRILEIISEIENNEHEKWLELLKRRVKDRITGAGTQLSNSKPHNITELLLRDFLKS